MRRLIVLHIEDSPEDARLLARACEAANLQMGFQEVRSGAEAVAYLRGEGLYANRSVYPFPDIIILDLRMPGMTGFDFLKWLRGALEFSPLPVLVFSESQDATDKTRALAEGANGFFVKPGDFESLVRMAESLVQFGRIRREGGRQK